MQLDGARALVLGGTSGIGLATAHRLSAAGARVAVASRSAENLASAAEALGPQVSTHAVDILDRGGLDDLFESLPTLDVLVCSATGGPRAAGPFLEMDLDGFQGSFAKLWGYTNAVRLGAPRMSESASIVLVSGYPARRPTPGASAISTVGNAVEGFVRAIANEIAPRRINVVSPGAIATPMLTLPPDSRDAYLRQATRGFAIPRPGEADEVAQAILFLLENEFVTGTTVDVDGGALLS